MGEWGWMLGVKTDEPLPLKERLRQLTFSGVTTQWIDQEAHALDDFFRQRFFSGERYSRNKQNGQPSAVPVLPKRQLGSLLTDVTRSDLKIREKRFCEYENHLRYIYTDYLLSSFGASTATGLRGMLDGAISHDDVRRFVHHLPSGSQAFMAAAGPPGGQAGSQTSRTSGR